MPSEKQSHHNNSSLATRPLLPTLNTTTKNGRPPLTPRIAGSTTATRSPVLRRAGAAPATPTIRKLTPKDGVSTPVKTFLNTNITTRSSSRKHRSDSVGTTPIVTPNGTPIHSRTPSTLDATTLIEKVSSVETSGLGIGGLEDGVDHGPGSVITEDPASHHTSLGNLWPNFAHELDHSKKPSNGSPTDASPMFFLASDAKVSTSTSRASQARPGLLTKSPSFFYANQSPRPGSPGTAGPLSGTDISQGKLFQIRDGSVPQVVSGIPVTQPPLPPLQRPANPQRTATHALASPSWLQQAQQQPHRPLSPLRDHSTIPKAVPAQGSPRVIRAKPSASNMHRTSSTDSSKSYGSTTRDTKPDHGPNKEHRWPSHKRSISMISLEPGVTPKNSINQAPTSHPAAPHTPRSPSSPLHTSRSPSSTTPLSPSSAYPLSPSRAPIPASPSSPTKTPSCSDLSAASAAHQARRERKVLDLEISNSSLLAINRTLEREMRKQNAELRRFRRLSRSGRLSLASRGRQSILTASTDNLSDISGIDVSDNNDDEGVGDEKDDLSGDDSQSPERRGAFNSRRAKEDEGRLKLDLEKHQQLLIDSQKMNQSLKKCLCWTEEMIGAGRKALAYQVNVSEVEVGGRVLVGDEEDEQESYDHVVTAEDGDAGAQTKVQTGPIAETPVAREQEPES